MDSVIEADSEEEEVAIEISSTTLKMRLIRDDCKDPQLIP